LGDINRHKLPGMLGHQFLLNGFQELIGAAIKVGAGQISAFSA